MKYSSERLYADKNPCPPVRYKVPGSGNACVLKFTDRSFDFFYELQEEIHEAGLDHLGPNHITYKRLDMFKMIFKLANVESAFKPA